MIGAKDSIKDNIIIDLKFQLVFLFFWQNIPMLENGLVLIGKRFSIQFGDITGLVKRVESV